MDLGTNQQRVLPHLHQPERGEEETFAEYKARRAASNKANRNALRNPNHGVTGSRERYRDDMRRSGTMGKRIRASDALMAAWASKRVTKAALRDEHGAYTLVGSHVRPKLPSGLHDVGFSIPGRRIWLAGISAQRGY